MTQSMVIGYNPIKNMVIGSRSGIEDMRIISLYNPLINYKWDTITTSNIRYLKDSGTSPAYNAQLYFGQGVWFNGVDQRIDYTPVGATHTIYTLDGVTTYLTNVLVINTIRPSSIYMNLVYLNRALTLEQVAYYGSNPETFLYKEDGILKSDCGLDVSKIVAWFPMCEKDGNVQNIVSGTLYPILNYTTTARTLAQRLSYGLQTCFLNRDSNGRYLSLNKVGIQGDGVGYASTGYVSPLNIVPETFEIIIEKPKVVQSSFNKYVCGGASSADMTVEISSGSTTNGYLRFRKVGTPFTATQWLPTNTMLITMVCDGVNVFIYFNRVLFGRYVAQPYTASNPIKLMIEHLLNGSLVYNRSINQAGLRLFKVHTKALTEEEVTKNFNQYQAQGLLNV